MRPVSINVPNFGPGTSSQTLLEWARFAETNGFAGIVVSDHVALTPEVAGTYPPPFYDPFVLLAWLAGQTSRIRLATSVVVLPYRHPLLTARMSAMLHEQSGGRFALGVGAGWASTEFAALGLDPARRGEITDAYLRIIIDAWTHETVSADGAGVRFQDVATGPEPAGGRVPLWVGGNGLAAIRRAACFGDAWHPINPQLSWLRDRGIPALVDAAAAAQRPVPDLVVRIKARVESPPGSGPRPLGVGTLQQIVEDVGAIFGAGAAEVVLDPNPDVPTLRDAIIEQRHLVEINEACQRAE